MNRQRHQGFNIGYYIALASRRRWHIIVPFCVAVLVGSILAIKLPKAYEASTFILILPQRVPERLVQPIVSTDMDSRISTISQQILSRSNLEKIIEKFGLFSEEEFKHSLMEDRIESLRKRIKVQVSRSRRDADSFSITFQDRDPGTAMRVANGLASLFIDENLKIRENQAVGTSDFLDSELAVTRRRLEELEQELKKFRERHMGELPEQMDSNLRMLDRLNQALSQKEEGLRSTRVSLAALESELAARRNALAAVAPSDTGGGPKKPEELSLPQLQDKLAALRGVYTDQHPDVVRLKAQIEKREAELANNPPAQSGQEENQVVQVRPAAGIYPEAIRQRILLEGAIRAIESDIASINREIREYQRRVEATPKREQEMLSLKRDYENMKTSYNSLLNRRLEAEISVNMEKRQKGEQFQVIDPARLPEKPVSPDLTRLFMITVVVGLGLGGGLVFLLDQLDSSVRRIQDLEEELGLAVLATVPRIFSIADKMRHRYQQAATAVSILIALALTAGFAALAFNGVEPTLEFFGYHGKI